MEIGPNIAYSLISGFVLVAAMSILLVKYFPDECAEFIQRVRSPSSSAVKEQSDELLAQMDRNVTERKALKATNLPSWSK